MTMHESTQLQPRLSGLSDRAIAWLFITPTIVLLLAINIFPLLWTAYLATVIFTLPLAFFLFLGLFDTARTLTVTGSGPTSKP